MYVLPRIAPQEPFEEDEPITPEVIAIVSVGVALGGMILYIARGLNELRRDVARDVAGLQNNISDLRKRMARLEGLFEGYAGRRTDGSG